MSDIALSLFIQGTPAPGGSKSAFPMWDKYGNLVCKRLPDGRQMPILRMADAGGERNKKWKAAVAIQARAWMQGKPPFECPLKIEFVFFLKRPLCHYGTGRNANILKADAPIHHTQAPDSLKLARGSEDALTGIVYIDDSRSVRICSEKRWASRTETEGCAIRIVLL